MADAEGIEGLGGTPASPSPLATGSFLEQKATEARAQGVSWDDIHSYVNNKWEQARAAGVSDTDFEKYLGFKNPAEVDGRIRDHLTAAFQGMKPPTTAEGFTDALTAGWQDSVLGYGTRGALPSKTLGENPTFPELGGEMIGSLAGDVIPGVVGAIGGAAAGTAVSPGVGTAVGAGAGFMALPTAIKDTYIDGLMNGHYKGPADAAARIMGEAWDTTKAAAEGAMFSVVGGKAGELATKAGINGLGKTATELLGGNAGFLAAQSTLNGRLPTREDLIDAGLSVALMHAVNGTMKYTPTITRNIAENWAATDKTPAQTAAETVHDPSLYEKMVTRAAALPRPGSAHVETGEPGEEYVIPRAEGAFDEAVKGAPHAPGMRFGVTDKIAPDVDIPNLSQHQAETILHDRVWQPLNVETLPEEFHKPVLATAAVHGVSQTEAWINESKGDLKTFRDLAQGRTIDDAHYNEIIPTDEWREWVKAGRSNQTDELSEDAKDTLADRTPAAGRYLMQPEQAGRPDPWKVANYSSQKFGVIRGDIGEGGKGPPPPGGEPKQIEGPAEPPVNGWANPWDKAREAIAPATEKVEPESRWARIQRALFDRDAPINRLWGVVTEGRSIPAANDFRFWRRMEETTVGRARQWIEGDQTDHNGNVIGPGLQKIMAGVPKAARQDFETFLMARRSLAERAKGLDSAMDETAAKQVVEQAALKYGDKFDEPMAKLRQYRTNMLKYGVETGFFSKSDVKTITDEPMFGIPGWREREAPGARRPGSSIFNPVHAVTGGKGRYVPPIEALVRDTILRTQMFDRSASVRALANEAIKFPELASVETMSRQNYPASAAWERTNAGLGVDKMMAELAGNKVKDGDVPYYDNGVPKLLRLNDPVVASILLKYNETKPNIIFKALGAATKPLRWMIVNGNPLFAPSISLMDVLYQSVTKPDSLKWGGVNNTVMNFGSGLFHSTFGRIIGDDVFDHAARAGAIQPIFEKIERDKQIQDLINGRSDKTINGWKTGYNVVKHPLEWWTRTWFNAPAIGRFARGIKAGEAPAVAGAAGTEAVFHRGAAAGDLAQSINKIIPFFSAHMINMEKTARSMLGIGKPILSEAKFNPVNFAAKVTALVTVPMLLNWYDRKDDPRYQALSDYDKDNYLYSWAPSDQNSPMLRYRLPPVMGFVFGGIPRRIAEATYAHDPHAFDHFMGDFLASIAPPGAESMVPLALQAPIEAMRNYSFVTGRPLVSDTEKRDLLPQDRYNSQTTETGKIISRFINNTPLLRNTDMSPIQIDHWISGWAGPAGRSALRTTESLLRESGTLPQVPAKKWFDTPIFNGIAARMPSSNSQPIIDYEQRMQGFNQVHGSLIKALENNDVARFQEILKENPQTAAMHSWRLSHEQAHLMNPAARAILQQELSTPRAQANMDDYRKVIEIDKALKTLHQWTQRVEANNDEKRMTPDEQRQSLDQAYLSMLKWVQYGTPLIDKLGVR